MTKLMTLALLGAIMPVVAQDAAKTPSFAQEIHQKNIAPIQTDAVTPRPAGSIYMGDFRAPKIEKVRVCVIGLGERGTPQTIQLAHVPNCEVVGVCDLYDDAAQKVANRMQELTGKRPATYSQDKDAYKKMLAELKPDAVIINTNWDTHAQMAIEAMESGAHAFVEVPLATTIEDLWRVVDASERTQKHCMMMENCNYGREELMFLNMVRQGLIGDLLHGEASYIHELRSQMFDVDRGCGSWRTYHYAERNANLYPTHGLGPVAQYMNIARTDDTFDRIVSFGSPALGRAKFAKENLPADHKWNQTEFKCADMSNSIIKTKAGRTILVQWDETSPRPYDRRNLIQGTHGTLAGFPTRAAGCGINDGSAWLASEAEVAELRLKYEHPLWKRLGAEALRHDPRGGMNYLLFARIIECLHHGLPLDQNVYEGALWSAVAPLTEKSVSEGGAPQLFPDFTRGAWSTTAPLGIVE